jgi:23S rRNA pseudouridine1911/1915/1917 synthase
MPENALRIQYEDESLIAVDKPPGIVVHPTYKNKSGTLLDALLCHLHNRSGVLPRIITRLDKDTSGLVLVALTPEAHARVQKDAHAGRVKKEYLAVVRGIPDPPRGAIVLPLARSPEDRRRVVVTPTGQHAETRYELIESRHPYSLVRCELITGRTHQIRVHLAANGWPVVGDPTYGEPHEAIGRQALHSWRIAFRHPTSGESLQIEAPIPADVRALIKPGTLR